MIWPMTTAYVWTVSLLLFFSELTMLAALAFAGYRLSGRGVIGVIVAVVAVAAAATLWGLFAAPRATYDIPAMVWMVKIGLYAGATALLATAGARLRVVVGFAVFSAVINVLSLLPPVRGATI